MLACHYGGYKGWALQKHGPAQVRIVLITCVLDHSLNAMLSYVMVLSMNPHPLSYTISASSEGSGKTE